MDKISNLDKIKEKLKEKQEKLKAFQIGKQYSEGFLRGYLSSFIENKYISYEEFEELDKYIRKLADELC